MRLMKIRDGEIASISGALISYQSGRICVTGELPKGVHCRVEGDGESMVLDDCPPHTAEVYEEEM